MYYALVIITTLTLMGVFRPTSFWSMPFLMLLIVNIALAIVYQIVTERKAAR